METKVIDLRSDTVTKPTAAMRAAISASVAPSRAARASCAPRSAATRP